MSEFVINILEDFLGDPRKHNEEKGQISFDCPACADDKGLLNGDGKGNLEVNYHKGVFKCWACKDINNMSGYIPNLIRRYGQKKHIKQYLIVNPEYKKSEEEYFTIKSDVKLPESFTSLSNEYPYDKAYNEAIEYLSKRGITKDIIDYYNLGYTNMGKHFLRVVIPSYNAFNELNYFAARSFSWVKPKYMNDESDKQSIIFNENKINWDATIYLVEGPFDHIVTPNSIPLLGKYMYPLLFETLIEKAKCNIVIVLDPDARKDAINLYKELFYSPLNNQVRIVELPGTYDIAKIHEKLGPKGVISWLRTAHKLNSFDY